MKRVVPIAIAIGVLVACRDQQQLTAPTRPSADFSDGTVAGGNLHFFFLPPLVKQPSFSGTFNPALRPVVEICQLDVDINNIPIACSATAPTINPGIVELDLVDELYQVNWNTLLPPIDVTKFYRIQVRVATGGTILGFADVDPVLNGTELKNVNTGEFIGLVDGRTLPIKFRIEIGTTCKTTDCFEGTVGAAGGTFISSSGLAGTFFPVGALSRDVFLVIDRVDARPCVPLDLPQFTGCYRFSTDPRPDHFNSLVTVGMCVDKGTLSDEQHDLLHIFQFDAGFPAVALMNVPATFLGCDPGHLIGSRLPPGLRELARLLASVLMPAQLHAAHVGVGGSSGSYSIFGWALPATMGANDGDNQTAVAGSAVTTAPSVVLRDSSGTPVAGATVTFAAASGDGAVTNPVAVTGSDGIARVGSWTLGSQEGANTLSAMTAGAVSAPVTFTATGVASLISCGGDPGGDESFRGFYVPSYPGTTLAQVDLFLSASLAGTYTLTLTARSGTYDGPVTGTSQATVTLDGNILDNVQTSFAFPSPAVATGTVLTFALAQVAGPADATVYFSVPKPGDATCPVTETEDTAAPLSTFRRNGVRLRITGRSASRIG